MQLQAKDEESKRFEARNGKWSERQGCILEQNGRLIFSCRRRCCIKSLLLFVVIIFLIFLCVCVSWRSFLPSFSLLHHRFCLLLSHLSFLLDFRRHDRVSFTSHVSASQLNNLLQSKKQRTTWQWLERYCFIEFPPFLKPIIPLLDDKTLSMSFRQQHRWRFLQNVARAQNDLRF